MIPIFEQGSGRGIGHGLDSFLARFDEICSAHLAQGRAKAFAFILYDFTNDSIQKILRNQGVFAQLDRLAGRDLSVFYLHAGTRRAIEAFNAHFFSVLGVEDQATLPCVVFFRVDGESIEDVQIAALDSADLIHGFHELYGVIEEYLGQQRSSPSTQPSRAIRWIKASAKFLSVEGLRAALKSALDMWF